MSPFELFLYMFLEELLRALFSCPHKLFDVFVPNHRALTHNLAESIVLHYPLKAFDSREDPFSGLF